jgi:hypothetical protein
MIVLGLTGGIGMGKSTAAAVFRRAHIPVFDADAEVHRLQAPRGHALPAIEAAFPGTVIDGVLDRARLREAVIGVPEALRRLEAILHPMVGAAERRFLASARRRRAKLAVLAGGPDRGGLGAASGATGPGAGAAADGARADRRHHRPPDAGSRQMPPRRPCGAHRPVAASCAAGDSAADPRARQGRPAARMTRAVLFDTETTGLAPEEGHRVIEVAALELVNDLPTGRFFHTLIDPERDIPPDATRVHGFTRADLAGKPLFAAVAAELLAFLGDGQLVAHNAAFDFNFLDAEFSRAGLPALPRPTQQPGRAMPPLRHRPLGAHHAQRPAGLPAAVGGLCPAHWRPPARPGTGRRRCRRPFNHLQL